MAKPRKSPKSSAKREARPCWCGHVKERHTAGAGCLGDGGPGANCSCDEFEPKP